MDIFMFHIMFCSVLSHVRRLQLKPGETHNLPKTLQALHLKQIVDQLPETFVSTSGLVAMAPLEASLEHGINLLDLRIFC